MKETKETKEMEVEIWLARELGWLFFNEPNERDEFVTVAIVVVVVVSGVVYLYLGGEPDC